MEPDRHNILILDCDHKNALAIIRHLGRTGLYHIDGISQHKSSVGFFSKYLRHKYVLSHPKTDPLLFLEELLTRLKDNAYLTVIPVSYISFQICAEHVSRIRKYTRICVPDIEAVRLASSKIKTYDLAESLGIPYPEIKILKDIDELDSLDTSFPCVIKAAHEAGKNIVDYAADRSELISRYRKMCRKNQFSDSLPIIQRYVKGGGFGFFAYYEQGICRNYFMHKRIREYPVSGGASTVAESFHDEKLFHYGKTLLDHLKWNGVAMVEFKKDELSGEYLLMEINAKFWGSLDLALICGVNFPQMLIDNALLKPVLPAENYPKKRFQWILNGDLYTVLERPWFLFSFVYNLFRAKNDIYLRDIKPNLFQFLYIPVHYYKKWFK